MKKSFAYLLLLSLIIVPLLSANAQSRPRRVGQTTPNTAPDQSNVPTFDHRCLVASTDPVLNNPTLQVPRS